MPGQPPAPSPHPDASKDAADILAASDMCIVQIERGREQDEFEVRRASNVKRRKKRRRRREKMMSSRMMEMWTNV